MSNSPESTFTYRVIVREMKPVGDKRYYAKVWVDCRPHPDFQEYWGKTEQEAENRAEEAVAEWIKQRKQSRD